MTTHDDDQSVWIGRAARSLGRGWQLIAEAMGERSADWDEAWLADAVSPNPFLNGATLARPLQSSEATDLTRRLEAYFLERPAGGPWLIWSAWPTPDLSEHGYILWGHPPIMLRPPGGTAPPPPPDLRIVEAHDAATLAVIERTFLEAYPALGIDTSQPGGAFPPSLLRGPYRFWGGYVGNEMVSVAAAVMEAHHTDVFYIATQPHMRGKGYGAALTWTATLADPSKPAVLEASDDGRPVYERMGYREIGRMSLWERPRDPSNPVWSPYAPPTSSPAEET